MISTNKRIWDTEKEIRKLFAKKVCTVPEAMKNGCSKQIILAHTLQKNGSLSKIARDGHVYSFNADIKTLMENKGVVKAKLIGVNKASTFFGFCSYHDDELFKPIEKREFSGEKEQCFLLAYRALARENYQKEKEFTACQIFEKKAEELFPNEPESKKIIGWRREGVGYALRDFSFYKNLFEIILSDKYYNDIRAYIIWLKKAPPIMCLGGNLLDRDFLGQRLQNLGKKSEKCKFISYASFASGEKGAIVFIWHKKDEAIGKQLISSLDNVPKEELERVLLEFFLEKNENVFFEPNWWEGFNANEQAQLADKMMEDVDPFDPFHKANAFPLNVGNWGLEKTELI